jgi:peptide/nickel transport system permease protein
MTDITEPVASRLTLDRLGPVHPPDQGLRSQPQSMWRVYVRRFFRHRFAAAGLVVLVLVTLSAILAPLITSDPNALSASDRKAAPSMEHWFGTDEAGRDIFARTIHGGRVSLAVGLAATGVALVIGTLVGAMSGFFGGLVDAVLMRMTDAFLCFPQLFVLIVFGTLMRTTELRVLQGNMIPISIIIGLLSWMGLARIVRATFLSLREQDYVEAARSVGAGNTRIMFRHVLPGAVGPIVVQATLLIAVTIITESGLSYLGFGVQPPTSSWGNLLEGAKPFLQTLPVYAIAPGTMIFLTVMSINFVGDGLRDALDPHSQR